MQKANLQDLIVEPELAGVDAAERVARTKRRSRSGAAARTAYVEIFVDAEVEVFGLDGPFVVPSPFHTAAANEEGAESFGAGNEKAASAWGDAASVAHLRLKVC